jgi:tRNA threonylcarbamoyladenosine biosynthesis protein TsaB
MTILAFEFSSPQRSVAVLAQGTAIEVVETGSTMGGILVMAEDALRAARVEREQVERLAVGLGPGSYTGIRAAIAVAQGWQLARGTKLLGVSSAQCVAARAQQEGITGGVNVVIDAQRDEFYLAGYEISENDCLETGPLRLATLAELRALERAGEPLIGPEVTRWFPNGRVVFPRALILGTLAMSRSDFVPGEKLEPIYLRETRFVKAPPPRKL